MKKTFVFINNILGYLCMIFTGLLTILVIFSVFLRYVFNISFIQSEEAITMTFIAICFFGAAYASKENEHVCVNLIADKLVGKSKAILEIFTLVISIIVEFMVFKGSLLWLQSTGNMLLPGMRLPAVYFYALVPISAVLIILYSGINIIKILFARNLIKNEVA